MARDDREATYNTEYCARIRAIRDQMGWTAEQMAIALGVPADRYRKYEARSPLPAYLVEPFCIITNCTIEHLLTGRGNKPIRKAPPYIVETKPKRKKSV